MVLVFTQNNPIPTLLLQGEMAGSELQAATLLLTLSVISSLQLASAGRSIDVFEEYDRNRPLYQNLLALASVGVIHISISTILVSALVYAVLATEGGPRLIAALVPGILLLTFPVFATKDWHRFTSNTPGNYHQHVEGRTDVSIWAFVVHFAIYSAVWFIVVENFLYRPAILLTPILATIVYLVILVGCDLPVAKS